MTQRYISHPEPLPACAAGHSARHIQDLRGLAAGGGHFVECRCRHTRKQAEPNTAIGEWKKVNRRTRSARKLLPAITEPAHNVVQLGLSLGGQPARQRAAGGAHGGG